MTFTRREFLKFGVVVAALPANVRGQGGEPLLEKIDLFQSGEGGYQLYRVPGIVVSKRGTVLAYCEARSEGKSDWETIDVLLRRSTDNGKTWEAPRKIASVEGPLTRNPVTIEKKLGRPGDITYNNPVAIADARSGAVHFVFCLDYGRCFHLRSDDDGATWSKPVEITRAFEAFRQRYPWRVIATGPGHGIQLKNGRLIVPVWLSVATSANGHGPSVTSVIYSDDGGGTWRAGEIIGLGSSDLINPSETVAVELADGRVALNLRSDSPANRRAFSYSRDGATGWSTPTFHPQLVEPICMASLIRLSEHGSGRRNRLLFANPDNLSRADGQQTPGSRRDRRNLSVKLSYDETDSWPISKTLESGPSAYSDLAVGHGGAIFCIYEAASPRGGRRLTLARFNLEWLTDGRDTY